MNKNEWNKQDGFTLRLCSPVHPLNRGSEGLDEILDFVESMDIWFRVDQMELPRKRKFSRRLLHDHLAKGKLTVETGLYFSCSQPSDLNLKFTYLDGVDSADCFTMDLTLKPFALVGGDQSEEYTQRLFALVHAFAQRFPISQGMAHSSYDYFAVSQAYRARHSGDLQPLHENAWWLNLYGPPLVERFGRLHLLSAPAAYTEELPGGAILILTRPTPADFDSEPARLAQARLLAHLHPEHPVETTLPALLERSQLFEPIPIHFDEDVAELLHWKIQARGLLHKRELVERYNAYHPPPVSEWIPTSPALAPDVEDVTAEISIYENYFPKQLLRDFSKELPGLTPGDPASLPRIDFYLWHRRYDRLPMSYMEGLIPSLGAWLGLCLVRALGGRWLPRRTLSEAAVQVGDRLWLPFLRARHALLERNSPLDSSCTQLFRLAQRLSLPPSS